MLYNIIEQAANESIIYTYNQIIVDNFDNNHINYKDTQSHNFNYDLLQQLEIIGENSNLI